MKIQKISYHFIKYNKRTSCAAHGKEDEYRRRRQNYIRERAIKTFQDLQKRKIVTFFLLVAILLCMDAERICERPFKANFHSDIDYFKKKKQQIFTRVFLSMLLRYVLV